MVWNTTEQDREERFNLYFVVDKLFSRPVEDKWMGSRHGWSENDRTRRGREIQLEVGAWQTFFKTSWRWMSEIKTWMVWKHNRTRKRGGHWQFGALLTSIYLASVCLWLHSCRSCWFRSMQIRRMCSPQYARGREIQLVLGAWQTFFKNSWRCMSGI